MSERSHNSISPTDRWREALVYVAWVQALIATLGSLIFSEVLGFIPCTLCWYQRILMYPLVLLIGVGILLRDPRVRFYGLSLSVVGLFVAVYHNLLYFGVLAEASFGTCSAGISCTTRWFEWFGFVSIPQLSLIAFTVVTACLLIYRSSEVHYGNKERN